MDIDKVYQKKVTDKRIHIYFTVHTFTFRMVLGFDEEEKRFYPYTIDHYEDDKYVCSVCGKNVFNEPVYTPCSSFDNRFNEIFQRLIEFPSIRLEWLYIPHVEQA